MKIMNFTKQGMLERMLTRQAEVKALGFTGTMRFVDTSLLAANALTQEKWPQTSFEIMLANMQLSGLMGGNDMPIVINKDLTIGAGNKVTFELDMPLSASGGSDDSTIEGNEEAMSFFNFPVEIHERSHGVRSAGKMTDKNTAINIRRKAIFALGRWTAEQVENDLLWSLSGIGNQNTTIGAATSPILTVNEKAPSSNRIFFGGQTAAGVVTEETSDSLIGDGGGADPINYLFGTKVIDLLKTRALLAFPKFKPVLVGGKWYYIILMHPLQEKALREETGNAGWSLIQQNAARRGEQLNRLFTKDGSGRERMFDGATGLWSDVWLFTYERLETRVAGEVFSATGGTNVVDAAIVDGTYRIARGLLLGAQAGVLGWGQLWQRFERGFDYKRKPGSATDALYGASKTQFRDPGAGQNTNTAQEDLGVYVFDTAVEEA